MTRIWNLITVILTGLACIYLNIYSHNHTTLISSGAVIALIFIAPAVYMYIVYRDIHFFNHKGKIIGFIPTFIGLVLIVIFFTDRYRFRKQTFSPLIISCVRPKAALSYKNTSIKFLQNGVYKMEIVFNFFDRDIYWGEYELRDSMIIMKSGVPDGQLESNRLVIRATDKMDSYGQPQKNLYETDSLGQVLPGKLFFKSTYTRH